MKPAANMDATSFDWPQPKLHRVRAYCREQLGWTEKEMDQQVDTVIERYANRSQQVYGVRFAYLYKMLYILYTIIDSSLLLYTVVYCCMLLFVVVWCLLMDGNSFGENIMMLKKHNADCLYQLQPSCLDSSSHYTSMN